VGVFGQSRSAEPNDNQRADDQQVDRERHEGPGREPAGQEADGKIGRDRDGHAADRDVGADHLAGVEPELDRVGGRGASKGDGGLPPPRGAAVAKRVRREPHGYEVPLPGWSRS
jgi:hypothetical protein